MSNVFTIIVVVVTAYAGGEVTGQKEVGLHMLKSTVEYCTESIAPYFNDVRTFEYEGVNHVVRTEATCYSQIQWMEKNGGHEGHDDGQHEGMDHEKHHKEMHGE